MQPTRIAPVSRYAVALVTALLVSACGDSDRGAIEIDLTSPKTPTQIVPGTSTADLATVEGPADFTVLLPQRTLSGRYRSVNVYSPIVADDSVPDDDPSRSVNTLDLRYDFTDDADQVIARLDSLIATAAMADVDRGAIEAWRDEFRTTTAASNGDIVPADFTTASGSNILRFPIESSDGFGTSLQVRIFDDGMVAMTLFVGFDNGIAMGSVDSLDG
jgi:hypothetical protein